MKASVHSIVAASVLALTALGCTPDRSALGPQIIIADKVSAKSVGATRVWPGDNIVLRLPTTAGNGYRWRTARKPAYEWNVMIISDKIEQPTLELPIAGAEQWQVIQMRATKPGIMAIDFVYDRTWEPNVPPAKEFTLNLEVVPR